MRGVQNLEGDSVTSNRDSSLTTQSALQLETHRPALSRARFCLGRRPPELRAGELVLEPDGASVGAVVWADRFTISRPRLERRAAL